MTKKPREREVYTYEFLVHEDVYPFSPDIGLSLNCIWLCDWIEFGIHKFEMFFIKLLGFIYY